MVLTRAEADLVIDAIERECASINHIGERLGLEHGLPGHLVRRRDALYTVLQRLDAPAEKPAALPVFSNQPPLPSSVEQELADTKARLREAQAQVDTMLAVNDELQRDRDELAAKLDQRAPTPSAITLPIAELPALLREALRGELDGRTLSPHLHRETALHRISTNVSRQLVTHWLSPVTASRTVARTDEPEPDPCSSCNGEHNEGCR